MKPSDIIAEVRRLIQDTRAPYRYSDAALLALVNQTLKRMMVLRPDLFTTIGDIDVVAGEVMQSCPAGSSRLVDIFRVRGGGAVTEVSRRTLDQSSPEWMTDSPGTPVNFMRHVRNPNQFFVYPAPTANTVLVGEYVQNPPEYTIDQDIDAPTPDYFPVVVDGVVFLAESVDNEHINSGRAKMFQESFLQALTTGLQSRVVTDTEEGGMEPKQVI